MKKILLKIQFLLLLSLGLFFSIEAQVIASWNFADEPGNQEFTPGSGSDGISALNFTRGTDLSPNAGAGSMNSSQWLGEGERYLSFGFVIEEGKSLNLSSLSIASRSSNTGPSTLALRASVDNFTSDLATWTQSGTANTVQTIDLIGLTGLKGTVEFRIFNTNEVSANGGTLASGGTFRVFNHSSGSVNFVGEITDPDSSGESPTLAFWDFAGEPGNQDFTTGTGSNNAIALNFTRGSGITPTSAANSISGSNWAVEANRYFSFGLEIEEGFEADLKDLVISSRSSGTGPGNLVLRYSIDDFTSDLATWSQSGTSFNNQIIDLSSLIGLQGRIEFRIFVLNTTSAGGGTLASGGTFRVGNFLNDGIFTPVSIRGELQETQSAVPVVVANWNFAGEPGNQESTAGSTDAEGIQVQDFARGADINPASASNSISSNGWNAGEDRFFTFGFTVAQDKLVDLNALQIGTRSSNTGPRDMALRYSGDGFTSNLATWTSENAFLNQVIDLSSLQNLTGEVEFRIVTISDVSANEGTIASGGTFRATNFFPDNLGTRFIGIVKEAEGVIVPNFNFDIEELDFGIVSVREEKPILSYQLSASNLSGPVTVNTSAPLSLSKDGNDFAASIVFTTEELNGAQSVFVKLDNESSGNLNLSISHETNGTTPVSLPVKAAVFDPFNIQEDFNNSCPEGLPSGWIGFSVEGPQEWECTNFGRAGTTSTANAPFGLQMNGFAGGTQVLNEDWLITPAYDLTEFDFPLLSFWSRAAFEGPRLRLLVSTDYEEGDPRAATWNELPDRFATQNIWTFSEEINLDVFKSANVRIAFVYNSSIETGATRWTLDDFALRNSSTPPAPFLVNDIGNVDYWHFGIQPVGTVSTESRDFRFSLSDAVAPLTIEAIEGFEFSKNGTDFFASLSYTPEEAGLNNLVTIRFAPQTEGAFSGPIKFTSGDLSMMRGFLTGATLERKNTFDVVTWNIEWFGSTRNNQGPSNVELQLQNVKKVIEDLQADVYAFQEITNLEKFNELVSSLEGYEGIVSPAVSQGPDSFETGQKLTFLYKTATVEKVTSRVLLEGVQPEDLVGYPSTPDRFWASGRLPFLMEVKTNINGVRQNINLINVHTRSNGGGESAANPRYAMRRYDVNVLKDSLDTYYANVPLIILGDFNDDLDETVADQTAPTVNISETSFINYINDPENYIPVTLSLSQAGLRTFPTFENVIDHMIITDELRENWLVNSERVVAPFELIPNYLSTTSDHIPVKTRFTLTCDLELGNIVGIDEVCAGNNEILLILVGGNYSTINGWEFSEDNGENWHPIASSAGLSEIIVNDLSTNTLFRAILSTDICGPEPTMAFEVKVNRLPEPIIFFEESFLITIEGNYTYNWFKDGALVATTQENRLRIQGRGNYEVEIVNEKGCNALSESFAFPQQRQASQVLISPNPTNYLVNITLKNGEGLQNVVLMSTYGLQIDQILTEEGFATFDVSNLAKGVYLIMVTDQFGNKTIDRLLVN